MNIVTCLEDWQNIRKNLTGRTIGFVPTMGHLHAGHFSLVSRARDENDVTVVSIFVNPTQFNQAQDFESYPRTLEEDIRQLDVDYVLVPAAKALYLDDYQIQINETQVSQELEGKFRPGHFTGMLTVVLKLLNLVRASNAYFGEKDFQQLMLIKKMAAALFLPTRISGCETVRAADGLALSSRNSRLNRDQRDRAALFPALLNSAASIEKITAQLEAAGFTVDYIVEKWQRRLGAVWLDDVRLIDNFKIAGD